MAFDFSAEIIKKIEGFAARGATMQQIADAIGCARSTLYDHKGKNTDVSDAIKRGRATGVITVTNHLFEQSKKGNTTATIFYLINRDPENWKDRRHVDQTIRKESEHTEIKKTMTPQEASESYADTLRAVGGENVVPIKRRK